MRSLINHLQAQCKLHNLEANRCKKQCKELEDELVKVKARQETTMANSINGFSTQTSIAIPEPLITAITTTINHQQESPTPTIKEDTNPFSTPAPPIAKTEVSQKDVLNTTT